MDYTNTDFWIAIGVGGSVVASLSAGQQFMAKDREDIRYRAVFRDFCFGAFLTAILYMFLPESIQNWILVGQSTVKEVSKGVVSTIASESKSLGDYELQLGPARF